MSSRLTAPEPLVCGGNARFVNHSKVNHWRIKPFLSPMVKGLKDPNLRRIILVWLASRNVGIASMVKDNYAKTMNIRALFHCALQQ